MIVEAVRSQVNTFQTLLQNFANDPSSLVELKKLKEQIKQAFPEVNTKMPDEERLLWNEFQLLVQSFNQQLEQLKLENESFAVEANMRIQAFEQLLHHKILNAQPTKDDFTMVRAEADQVFEFIKQQQWPSKETRTIAWDKFKTIKDAFREAENNYYNLLKEERQKKTETSSVLALMIIEAIEACTSPTSNAAIITAYNTFHQKLVEANAELLPETELPLPSATDDGAEISLKLQSEVLQRIRNEAIAKRDFFVWDHRQKVFETIDASKSTLNNAWEQHKAQLQQKREERLQKKKEWETKQQSFLAMLQQRLSSQINFKHKLNTILDNQTDFLNRIDVRQSSQKAYLEKLFLDLEELQEQHNTAWSDNFKQKTLVRITAKKDKIAEVEKDIEQGEQKRADAEKQLQELPARIEEIEQSILEIQNKIEEVNNKLNG